MTHTEALRRRQAALINENDMTMIDRACVIYDWAEELAALLDASGVPYVEETI